MTSLLFLLAGRAYDITSICARQQRVMGKMICHVTRERSKGQATLEKKVMLVKSGGLNSPKLLSLGAPAARSSQRSFHTPLATSLNYS